jgi:hypothetical protein
LRRRARNESRSDRNHPAQAILSSLPQVHVGDGGLQTAGRVHLRGVRMITDPRAEEAFEYLRDSTAAIGAAKAELVRSEILRKRTRKRIFLGVDGPVAQREAVADIHADTLVADDRYIEAVAAFETLSARREVETMALDVWRTESANRRRA